MKIETQNLEDHEVKITVEFEPEVLDAAKKRAARKLAGKTKVPGFRPGKAPYHLIASAVGEANILEEAIEIIVQDKYSQIIEEAGIRPYGPGRLESLLNSDPLQLEFVVPLDSEVILGNYTEIRRDYEPKSIEEDEIEQILDDLLDRQAVEEPVNRPAEEGDIVYVRLSAERLNAEEGKDPAFIKERSVPIRLDDQDEARPERQWPYPGFAKELYGLQAGDERSFQYTYPEDAGYEALGGVEASFHVVVEDVKARIRPQLDDEFAKTIGAFETVDALRAAIQESLEQQAKENYDNEYNEAVLKEAIAGSEFKYPPQMLEDEIDSLLHNLEHRLEQQNLDMDLYLKTRNIDQDQLREEMREAAEERMKRSMFLYKLAEVEGIEVPPQELEMEYRQTVNYLAQSMSKKEARRLSDRTVVNNILTSVMADLVAKRALRRIQSIASGQPEPQDERFNFGDIEFPELTNVQPAGEEPDAAQEIELTGAEESEVEIEAPAENVADEPESDEGETPAA